MSARLDARAVREAGAAVSREHAFRFSKRNLYYELLRRGALPPEGDDPAGARRAFRLALAEHEREAGRVPGLIRLSDVRGAVPAATERDVFDYAVRRVLVFDRKETMLVFAMNGFHRRIEVALLALPDFPIHVFRRLTEQVASGLRTAFYLVHDCDRRGLRLRSELRAALAAQSIAARSKAARPLLADVGLTFAQAFQQGIPVRARGIGAERARKPLAARADLDPEECLLHDGGSYAHLEELPPYELMNWTYTRIARGAQDPGFG